MYYTLIMLRGGFSWRLPLYARDLYRNHVHITNAAPTIRVCTMHRTLTRCGSLQGRQACQYTGARASKNSNITTSERSICHPYPCMTLWIAPDTHLAAWIYHYPQFNIMGLVKCLSPTQKSEDHLQLLYFITSLMLGQHQTQMGRGSRLGQPSFGRSGPRG
jgi:hypothetical protein